VSSVVAHAAVLEGFGEPLVVREVELDSPGRHEVVVRTAACGICHSDRSAQAGDSPRAPRVPIVLGHEASGIVERVGAEVSRVGPGDPVVACAAAPCGVCSWCRRGLEQHCESPLRARPAGEGPRLTRAGEAVDAFVGVGGFATQMLLHERALVRIPDDMPLERAAVLGCAVHTAFGAVRDSAGVVLGDTVAVIGCGGVGLNIVQAVRMAGASQVIAIDVHAARLERARAFGATDGIDATEGDPVAAVRELTGGGVDHSFEAVGRPATIAQACAMARKRGTITVVGLPRPGEKVEIPAEELFDEKRLQGSKMGRNFLVDIPWYCEMYLAGRLKLDELVSGSIALDDVNGGLDALETATAARTVIAFGST
jgi:S-(hydroxymethyl)glutathione dehydrogenase / alcohol dehydrogenase